MRKLLFCATLLLLATSAYSGKGQSFTNLSAIASFSPSLTQKVLAAVSKSSDDANLDKSSDDANLDKSSDERVKQHLSKKAQGPVYIIHSDEGSLTMTHESEAVLELKEVDQTVPYVFSHPVRKIGAERLPEFMRVWTAGGKLQYDKDPPDAHLLYYDKSLGDYIDLFVELLETSYDEDMRSISFRIHIFTENPKIKENLGEVTLFVDCFPFCV